MSWEIANMLANYLEASPDQVMEWDRDVVKNLGNNYRALNDFKQGCAQTRWGIYHTIKYAGSAWASAK